MRIPFKKCDVSAAEINCFTVPVSTAALAGILAACTARGSGSLLEPYVERMHASVLLAQMLMRMSS